LEKHDNKRIVSFDVILCTDACCIYVTTFCLLIMSAGSNSPKHTESSLKDGLARLRKF